MVLRLQKSAPNSCGLLSGFHSVSLCLLLQVSIVVSSVLCFRWKKPPPCHLPAAATPHARRAHPTAKNFVFASGPPSYRPGEVRGASSLVLRPVISFPFLAQTHMFFGGCKAQRFLTSLHAAASTCHLPSPNGNPRQLSNSCCYSKTQCFLFGSRLRLRVPALGKIFRSASLHSRICRQCVVPTHPPFWWPLLLVFVNKFKRFRSFEGLFLTVNPFQDWFLIRLILNTLTISRPDFCLQLLM